MKIQNFLKQSSLFVRRNKLIIHANLNLVKRFDVLENDYKMKLGNLVICFLNYLLSKF